MSPAASLRPGDLRRMAGTTWVYTLGTVAVRGAGLLLIPIYWRVLSPVDYGIVAVADILKVLLSIFLGLGISEALTRFYHSWPELDRADRVGTVWVIDWATSFAIGVPVALWGWLVTDHLIVQAPFHPYLQLAALVAICASLSNTPLATLRILERPWHFVSCSIASFVFQALAAIWFVVVRRHGAVGVLEAQLVAGVLMIPIYADVMRRHARLRVRRAYLHEVTGYSLPLVPGAFVESLTSIADRFMLEKYVSLADLGLYAVADSLAMPLRLFGQSIKTGWWPFAMRTAVTHRDDGAASIASINTYCTAMIVAVALALAVLCGDLVSVIGVPRYLTVATIVPWFMTPYTLLALAPLCEFGLRFARKGHYSSIVTTAQLATLIVGYIVLVPRFGIYGAIGAATIGWLTRCLAGLAVSQRFYRIPFEWRKMAAIAVSAVVAYGVTRLLPNAPSVVGLSGRIAVLVTYAFFLLSVVLGRRDLVARLFHPRSARSVAKPSLT